MGGGFGLCWSFVAQRVLNALPEADGAIGSAAIPMAQILGNAIGAAAAGVIANLLGLAAGFSRHSATHAAPILLGVFVPVALLAVAGVIVAGPRGPPPRGRGGAPPAPPRPELKVAVRRV